MVSARIASFLKENGWVFNLLFIALGAYFVAGAANAVVARTIRAVPTVDNTSSRPGRVATTRRQEPSKGFSAIANRNLLGAKREELHPPPPEDETVDTTLGLGKLAFNENELKPCTMSHNVRATLVAEGAPEWSMAVIYNNSDREAEVFSVNAGTNQVADDVLLVDIRSRSVVVRRREHFELCRIDDDAKPGKPSLASRATERKNRSSSSSGVTKESESQYTVDRAEVDNALANISKVATQARIVPSFRNGKPNGFKLFSIKPGSIYSKIGLKNGDVIQKINGYEMNSPDKALEIYQKLKDARSVSIEFQRRGQSKHFNYSIR
jgi:general secretion pathway protein C